MRHLQHLLLLLCLIVNSDAVPAAEGRAIHVDPVQGDDKQDGVQTPVRTIARAIRLAQPGDTIHLQPREYRDQATFQDKAGAPGKPITLEGHGAVLNGCDPLVPEAWRETEPGLFRHDDLLPLTDAIISRWFFLWDGQPNRMNRCSKGPSQPLKRPEELQPGEWTFVKDEERTRSVRAGYICGTFWIRLEAGKRLAEARIEAPLRMAGVSMHGACRHLVVRDVTSIHPYNDGFNLSNCQQITFENIRAVDCGDDGISAHGESDYDVTGFVSIGNATGICDTGHSRTSYRNVYIRDCAGFDLYFLDTGTYSVRDAVVISSAARSLYLSGREKPEEPCRLTLENVVVRREKSQNEIRVSPNCELTAQNTTFLGLDLQATGGQIRFENCVLAGSIPAAAPPRKPRMHLWKDAAWGGRGNLYDVESIRVGQASFAGESFARFQELIGSEEQSRRETIETIPAGVGADEAMLQRLVPERSGLKRPDARP